MNIKELNRRVREIVALTRTMEQHDWELADKLRALGDLEYEQALPRLIDETGWTRHRLMNYRQTARLWSPSERMADVPFATHRQYRYRQDELKRAYRTRTVGQASATRRQQRRTRVGMTSAIATIIELCDDKTLTDRQRVIRIRQVVEVFRGKRAA